MSDPLFSVAGKCILVTGAATGIGRATATLLARQGASVLGIGLDGDEGRSLEKEAAGLSGRLHFREVDLTRQATVDQAVRFAVETFGSLQGIVNCAAVCNTGKRLEDLSTRNGKRRSTSMSLESFGCVGPRCRFCAARVAAAS